MRSLAGRVAAVTGAAGGLGSALCRAFGTAGARIAAIDRDAQGLERLGSELRGAGLDAETIPCDVTRDDQCAEAFARARSRFGGIDILINNAGITHRSAFAHTDAAVIRRVMEVNFFGAVNCTRAALPSLIERRGQIIAISSVAGFAPLIGRTGYAASKHALHGFFESLRTEVEPLGVGVLLVCPSFVATGIDAAAMGGDGRPLRRNKPVVGRVASPEAIAAEILRSAAAGRRLLLPGTTARAAWWLSRLAPQRYARMMASRLRAELDTGSD